jgi:hypothetical protein
MKPASFLLIILSSFGASAQFDTTYKYYSAAWKDCGKDTATFVSKVFVAGNQWQRNDYWVKGMKLQSEENFADSALKIPVGSSTYFNDKGAVTGKHTHQNGKVTKALYYFDNGNKKAIVLYDTTGQITQQTGWEVTGEEIPHYIYEQEAYFPGGREAWTAYLISKINPNTAATKKTPNGIYTVKVQFIVNKEGKIENAQAIEVPVLCPKCGVEAVKIINSSPRWHHATQYGHPVIYQAIQNISWTVED